MLFFHDDGAIDRIFRRDEVRQADPVEQEDHAPDGAGPEFRIDRADRRENLDVQVKLEPRGWWHKKAVGGMHTACGHPLGGYATRAEAYSDDMCPTCFTPFEIKLGATAADQRAELARAERAPLPTTKK